MQEKLDNAITKHGPSAREAVSKLIQQGQIMKDYLVPVKDLYLDAHPAKLPGEPLPKPMISFADIVKESGTVAHLHTNAIQQLASKLGLPGGFMRNLGESSSFWQRKLMAHTFQRYIDNFDAPDNNLLVRIVGNEVRGILSDKYRRMNMALIFLGFGDIAQKMGAVMYDGTLGELRGFLEVVIPSVRAVETPNNGTVYMAFGAQISSSDFGQGTLSVLGFGMQVWCTNKMTRQTKLREVHLGKRLEASDMTFSEETYRKDSETVKSMIHDILRVVLSETFINEEIARIQGASARIIDVKHQIEELPKMGMSKEEAALVERFMLESDPDQGVYGKPTIWKLQQAITASAQTYEPVRQRELELLAGKL
jgi:hypothetical protein